MCIRDSSYDYYYYYYYYGYYYYYYDFFDGVFDTHWLHFYHQYPPYPRSFFDAIAFPWLHHLLPLLWPLILLLLALCAWLQVRCLLIMPQVGGSEAGF